MCGIFGFSRVAKAELKRAHTALNTLAHRGPDGWSFTHTNGVYVGHRRLSILDLSTNGTQPMVAKGVHLTVNGEIYNFKELRTTLEKKHKVKFKSGSDSEVLLHGYIHWGIDELMRRVDGMFAMALYDDNKKMIHLARDHTGIKPLYYSLMHNQLGWASELKALVNYHGKKALSVDYTAVYDFMTYLYVPAPKSLYHGIYKLEPGTLLSFDVTSGDSVKKHYWQLPVKRDVTDETQARQLVQKALTDTVREQLVADVPVGSFLSGGVDSSIVSYEAAAMLKQPLTTCSIGFENAEVDETRFAEKVAKLIGSKHKTRRYSHEQVNKNLGLLRELFDEPFADTSAFPTAQVSELARENMTVVLTGDGGDEIFGGYNNYMDWYQALTPWLGFLFPLRPLVKWAKENTGGLLHRLLRKVEVFTILDPLERQLRLRGGMMHDDPVKVAFRRKHGIPESYDDLWFWRPFYKPELPLKSRAMYLDFHTSLPEDMLTKVDRTSMAVAIETRVPFLAKRVIEAAWRLDEKLLFKGSILKGFLKALYADRLPQECLYRPKQGFSLGKTKKGDKLALNGRTLPEVILEKLYPELLT